jgi:hypothetical protein
MTGKVHESNGKIFIFSVFEEIFGHPVALAWKGVRGYVPGSEDRALNRTALHKRLMLEAEGAAKLNQHEHDR